MLDHLILGGIGLTVFLAVVGLWLWIAEDIDAFLKSCGEPLPRDRGDDDPRLIAAMDDPRFHSRGDTL